MSSLRPFRAWDGEGAEPEDPKAPQLYVIMCADDYPHLYRAGGIPTAEALAWLVEHQHHTPGIQICFGSTYDVNMILGDLDPEQVAALYLEADWEVELDDQVWRLQWIPGKMFNVRAPDGRWARTYDTFGFFQCSFVGALERWDLEVPAWLVEMKQRRGTFAGGHEYELAAYSELECSLHVQLMAQVRHQLRSHGLRPRTWHGAGAIASAALRTADVGVYMAGQRRPAVQEAIMRAYFGGRTEMFLQGEVAAGTQYDINSAYAAALRHLPDGRGSWRRASSWAYEGRWQPWGLWRLSWDLQDEDERLCPLPFRAGRGIFYPVRGEGWYHTAEVRSALRLYPGQIQIHAGYVFEPQTAAKPFAFVEDLYQLRHELAEQMDPTASLLKFGLASVWGKLSQATGRDGKVPRWQDYFWAGACTAIVRAWMLELAAQERDRLIQISTDGLLIRDHDDSPLDNLLGGGLGQLRKTELQEVLVAQPGMLSAWDAASGEAMNYTRGFFRREIDFEKLRAVWRAKGPRGQLPTKGIRFIGIGSCLSAGSFADWRRWKMQRQNLSLHSSRKYYAHLNGQAGGSYELLPPYEIRPGLSGIYEPKTNVLEALAEHLEWIQGTEQPLTVY